MRIRLLILSLVLGACKPEPKISSYEIKAQNTPGISAVSPATPVTAPAMNSNPQLQAEVASFGQPQWGTVPAHWKTAPANPMRKGSWIISSPDGSRAEMAVTVFPGDVGGDTANVNRWRGQLGLEKWSDAEVQKNYTPISINNLSAKLFTLVATDGKKTTLAVIFPKNNATWFFKLNGDSALVKNENEAFIKMVSATQIP